jgi:hypothetical protein
MGERNRGSMPPPPHNPPPLGIRNKHRQILPPFCASEHGQDIITCCLESSSYRFADITVLKKDSNFIFFFTKLLLLFSNFPRGFC